MVTFKRPLLSGGPLLSGFSGKEILTLLSGGRYFLGGGRGEGVRGVTFGILRLFGTRVPNAVSARVVIIKSASSTGFF